MLFPKILVLLPVLAVGALIPGATPAAIDPDRLHGSIEGHGERDVPERHRLCQRLRPKTETRTMGAEERDDPSLVDLRDLFRDRLAESVRCGTSGRHPLAVENGPIAAVPRWDR